MDLGYRKGVYVCVWGVVGGGEGGGAVVGMYCMKEE